MENWKTIPNFSNYEISDKGRVRNKDGLIMKTQIDRKGYHALRLVSDNKNGCRKRIHRLVAENFIPNPENKKTVNHINGNKNDNTVCNLEWNTYSENNKHAIETGLRKIPCGSQDSKAKLNEDKVKEIASLYFPNSTFTNEDIAKLYGVTRGTISKIRDRKTWKHVTKDLIW